MNESLLIANRLGFLAILKPDLKHKAEYTHGKSFFYRSDASNYDILHEIGHCIHGYGCCKEHDEYIVHGIAIGLAKAFNIKLSKLDLKRISIYAGSSSPLACPERTKKIIKDFYTPRE